MITTHFSGRTFLDLLKIVYAAYNREIVGTMFGRRNGEDFYVESLIPAQKLKVQKPTRFEISANQVSRLESVVGRVEQLLGYFHSHCGHWNHADYVKASLTPSDGDLTSLLTNECPILLMVAVNRSNRRNGLYVSDSYISGTLNGTPDRHYHTRVRIYFNDLDRHRIGRINVRRRSLREIFS